MTVVEREKMEQVLNELGKSFSGMIDSSTAAEIGNMLGVEAIVVGTVADMGNSVDLRARLVDVEKGAAITAAQIDVVKDPTITGLLGSGVRSTIYGERNITTPKEAKTIQEVKIQNFTSNLIKWQKKGDGIYFELIITSDQDSWLGMYSRIGYIPEYGKQGIGKTRIFDEFGNEYFASNIQLGNYVIDKKYNVQNTLIARVPMKVIVSFDNFSSQAKIVTLLEIRCYANDKFFSIQFKNIPITE